MKLNPQEIGKILTDHLDGLTTEEFIANVKEFCPYLFEEDEIQGRVFKQIIPASDHLSSIISVNDRVSQESANSGK